MKLREIIFNYLDSADSSSHAFRRLYNLASFGLRTEFSLDIKSTIKSVLIPVSANGSIAFPCDYISLSKIGVVNSNGEIATFKRNEKLTTYHSDYYNTTGNLSVLPTLPSFGINGGLNGYGYNNLMYLNFYYGSTSYNLFGLGSGTLDIGQYKIDETERVILFNPGFIWTQVVLEYMSDGCDENNDDYEVDIRCAEAMKCYIRWQDVVDRPKKAGDGKIQMLKNSYFNEKRKAKMRVNPVILNEMQNIERRSWKMVAKA